MGKKSNAKNSRTKNNTEISSHIEKELKFKPEEEINDVNPGLAERDE
jgi:hypothetical protein